MTTYESIREIRNKHYPPVLEFGCEVYFKNKGIEATVLHRNYAGNYLVEIFNTTTTIKEKQITRNLGEPVTLNDVLLMLEQKGFDSEYDYQVILAKLFTRRNRIYDLTKSVQDQTKETLESIYELIK